jgi:electron transfer flavoprotein beta subunit
VNTVVVAVRACAELQEGFELCSGDTQVDPDYVEYSLSDWDGAAVDAAIQLGDRVVAVSVGGEEAEPALRAALALGAAHAVHLRADEADDPLIVARLLAGYVAENAPDLVLCGVQSADHGGSAVPAALAGYLGWPPAAVVNRVESESADAVTVTRELENGVVHESTVALPAVVSIQTGTYEHQYPSFMAKRRASSYAVETFEVADLSLGDCQLEDLRGARTVRLRAPEAKTTGEVLSGPATDVAREVVSIINERLKA